MRRLLQSAIGAVLLFGFASQAQAQAYPDRPIRLIIPYSPGGITDTSARILAPQLSEQLGQQVVIDNRPGGAAMIGFGLTARAPADGYTLVFGTTALAANPILFKDIPYDARKDFTPISLIGVVPMVLVVPPSSPAKTLAGLIELAKSKPGGLNYGTAGNGSDNHLASELFNHLAGVKVTHVPYRGGGQVMTDLIAGRVAFVFATLPTALQFIGEGRLLALVTTGQVRTPALPQVPTLAESGMPDFVLYAWLGLLGPSGIPEPILAKLNTATNASLKDADTAERLRKIGLETKGGSSQELAMHLERELKRWSDLALHVKFEAAAN
jgi:tripartite-type tricarboxylate transporter receptor subunit TctC